MKQSDFYRKYTRKKAAQISMIVAGGALVSLSTFSGWELVGITLVWVAVGALLIFYVLRRLKRELHERNLTMEQLEAMTEYERNKTMDEVFWSFVS